MQAAARAFRYHPSAMTARTRTWPISPRRLVAVATDWAGDRVARWVDRTLAWIDPAEPREPPRAAIPRVVQPRAEPMRTATTPTTTTARTLPADEPPANDPPPTPLALRALALHASIDALEAALASTLEPAEVRRVRVTTRRLRTFVSDLKRAEIQPPRGVARTLRRCARTFADVRECDAQLERLHAETFGDEQRDVVSAHERRLVKRRAALVGALRRERDRLGAVALVRDLHAFVDAVLVVVPETPPWIETILDRRIADLCTCIPAVVAADQLEVLHRIRVRAKQLRYAVRWLGPLAPPSMRRFAKLAKRVQRAVGAHREAALLHDALVRRQAWAQARGRTAEVDALAIAMTTTRRSCEVAFAPIPALLAEVRRFAAELDH